MHQKKWACFWLWSLLIRLFFVNVQPYHLLNTYSSHQLKVGF